MSHLLTKRERLALERFSTFYSETYWASKDVISGISPRSVGKLLELGLVRKKQDSQGLSFYQMTPNGWICMYGLTHDQILNNSRPIYPLKNWRWPRNLSTERTSKIVRRSKHGLNNVIG